MYVVSRATASIVYLVATTVSEEHSLEPLKR